VSLSAQDHCSASHLDRGGAALTCQLGSSRVNESLMGWCFGVGMRAVLDVIMLVLQLYTYVIVIAAILSWLVAFNVINVHNDLVRSIWNALIAITEPVLRPIRQITPNLGGIDISPVILLLIIFLIQDIIQRYIYPNVY
jgi:YggT family protein